MGIFSNFLGKNDKARNLTVLDMLELDYKNIPDDSFTLDEEEINESGQKVCTFIKTLDILEFEIFDTLEVKLIGDNGKNVWRYG